MTDPTIIAAQPTAVHRLKNGLTLVVRVDRRAPVVAIVTRVAAGYFDEPDDVAGISHVLEHMFFKGTPTRGPGEIGRATKQAGGYLNASTIYNRTQYYTLLPSSSLEEGIVLQSDALVNAALDADELERELRVIIEEAKRKRDNPAAVAQESLYALMFRRHRMRRWRIGTEDVLAEMTRAQVHEFYRTQYTGPNVVLAVAGDVDEDEVVRLVEAHYAALPESGAPRDRGPAEPDQHEFRYGLSTADIGTAYVEWGWHTQPVLHADTPALDLLAVVMGQGRASRLYRAIRDPGHAQSVEAHNYTPEDLGVFGISIETTTASAVAALRACAAELKQAGDFSDAEIARARTVIQARLLRRMETVEGQANMLADWQALGDWQMAIAHYRRMLDVDATELRGVAERYLTPQRASLLVHAPQDLELPGEADEMFDLLFGSRAAPAGRTADDLPAVPALSRSAAELEDEEDGVRFYRSRGGARIVVMPRSGSGLVSLAIATAGGACMEQAATAGATGMMARVALKGTRSFTAAQLAGRTEALGGSIAADVGGDQFGWFLSLPSAHMSEGIALLAEAALHPTFPDAELERERANALAALEQIRDDMYRFPLRLCMAAAFPRHPYGFPIDVHEEAIRTMTRATVVDWHHQLCAPVPCCFVVGDVDADAAAAACAARLDEYVKPADEREQCAAPAVWPGSPARAVVERERAQTALALAFPGPRRNEVDADALRLLGNAVGGLGGRLFEELRSRRSLAYTVSAAPLARRHGGAFIAYIATSPDREEEARAAMLEELELLRAEPIDAADFERARRYTIGARRIRMQTNGAHLAELMSALLIGRGLTELRDFEQRIAALSPAILRGAAERWLDPGRLVEGVVRGRVPAFAPATVAAL